MSEIKLNIENVGKELTIREGQATPAKQPRKSIKVIGTLGIVKERLSKLPKEAKELQNEFGDTKLANSYILVDRDQGSLTLVEDAGMDDRNDFIGSLTIDAKFEKFGINSGKSYTTHELADFIKMNRTFFETKEMAMKLISELRNFKAKVDRQIENAKDDRGNKRFLMAQAVESNVPETFKLDIPIFKGYEKQKIEVEIVIDSGDLSCKLISPEASDFMEEIKDRLIDDELTPIREQFPDLKIFEI